MEQSKQGLSEEALDGWLGRVCKERLSEFPLSVAWPALLTAASVHAQSANRCNLFTVIIGRAGDGKSVADERAMWLMSADKAPVCSTTSVGSGEGLVSTFSEAHGQNRLLYSDEFSEFMCKTRIEASSLGSKLNELWGSDKIGTTCKHKKNSVEADVRLSLLGNLVSDKFDDSFHAGTVLGFYRRVLFGEWPSDVASYLYRPMKGERAYTIPSSVDVPEIESQFDNEKRPVRVTLSDDVFDERDRWVREEGIEAHVIEPGLRCAIICASFDNRELLQAKDLGPTLALLKYQKAVRAFRKPNEGENADAVLCNRIVDYLRRFAPSGEPVNQRKLLNGINAYTRFGMSAVTRALDGLLKQRMIVIKKPDNAVGPARRCVLIALSEDLCTHAVALTVHTPIGNECRGECN